MIVTPIKTRIFKENESIIDFIFDNIKKSNTLVSQITNGDILVVTSKIIALSQGRTISKKLKEEVIYKESEKVIKTPWALLTLTNQGWSVNAGADESNANKKIILFPNNPQEVAQKIRDALMKKFLCKNIGVVITDTRSVPLRQGTIGRAVGFSGFEAIKSYIGKKDLFGRKSRTTQSNIADALAVSAVFMMGEGNEQIPLVLIQNAPVKFTSKNYIKDNNLSLSPEKDLFSFVFNNVEQGFLAKTKKNHRKS